MPTRIDPAFNMWPVVEEWHVDNTLDYGAYKQHIGRYGSRFSASFETLESLRRHNEAKEIHKDRLIATERAASFPEPEKKVREEVLDEAISLTTGDREEQYGTPYSHFSEVAEALNAFDFSGPGGRKIMPEDVPFFQMVVKLSRILKTPDKRDSWVDIAGYAALGYEVVTHNE